MPLNYSKWDNLELSDDSDIEEHPNVDKKSMIRWKQRDIHEKREARKLRIAKLNSELSLNAVLRPRIQSVAAGVDSKGVDHFRAVLRRIREQPSNERPNTGAENQPTYDQMMGQLLNDIWRESTWLAEGAAKVVDGVVFKDQKVLDENTGVPSWAEGALPEGKVDKVKEALEARLKFHLGELAIRDDEVKKEIEVEEREQAKKITSDGIKDGWSASTVAKAAPSPLDDKPKIPKKTQATETIEVLNPGAASSSRPAPTPDPDDQEDEEADFGPLSPSARAFANIPLGEFEKSYNYIQKDSSVLTESTHDSLLAEAFDAERRGDKALAQRCVHQSLLVNYCRQLGRDGVGLFFQKIESRTVEILAEEASTEREQIQLVAEDPNMTISFNLPDGPPPADLRVEGEGAEELDIEQVRAFLQRKWEIFEGFNEPLKKALQTESLDEVNKVLGKMKVAEAEQVVELMQEGGMLSFSERGVRDMTQ